MGSPPSPAYRRRRNGGRCWQVVSLGSVQQQRGDDRTRRRRRLILLRVRAVEEVPAMYERRGAAAVEVHGDVAAELAHDLGQLEQLEPVVHQAAPPVAGDDGHVAVTEPDGGARMAP